MVILGQGGNTCLGPSILTITWRQVKRDLIAPNLVTPVGQYKAIAQLSDHLHCARLRRAQASIPTPSPSRALVHLAAAHQSIPLSSIPEILAQWLLSLVIGYVLLALSSTGAAAKCA